MTTAQYSSLLERMMDKIDADGPCWLWTSNKTKAGYGQVRDNGKYVLAHRAMWKELVGSIPYGMEMDHLCKVTSCCNPDHLEPVTRRENVRRSSAPRKFGERGAARARAKTHCPAGHPYDETNTAIYHGQHGSYRYCKACCRDRDRLRRARKAKA